MRPLTPVEWLVAGLILLVLGILWWYRDTGGGD